MFVDVIGEVFQPASLIAILLGTVIGVVIGALPGLSATMAIALLIPVTFLMEPIPGIILLVTVYTAGVYGGSISAILLYTPGTPANAAASLDGYPLTKQGLGYRAIIIATVSSMAGGILSAIALVLFAPLLSRISLVFGPQEYFWVAIFGLTIIGGLAGNSLLKGIIAALLGLSLSFVGIDNMVGTQRLTFGVQGLQSGVQMIPAMIGLFAVAQLVVLLRQPHDSSKKIPKQETSLRKSNLSFIEWIRISPTIIKSGVIGTGVGVLPGAGGDIASWIAYNEAKRASKTPEKFGTGHYPAIAAPESSNNAVVGGALIPTLTLGIPGSTATAILLGGLIMKGLVPGHELFTRNAVETYSIIAGFMIGTILMGIVGLLLARYVVKVADAPVAVLVAVIIALSVLGAYAIRNSMFDVVMMLVFGLIGYGLRVLNISAAPVILGLILGPIAERGFRQTMTIVGDENIWLSFLTRPISVVLIVLILGTLLFPIINKWRSSSRAKRVQAKSSILTHN
ncbi:tripartite tricarboxylate transporter permease [Citricoccus muralis]|uniref:Tripartite tricarboxylate transporter permease n=1 Tax=Citricoccus muralis TaxID=169134 RepID=A0ABY8H5B1_9MICC|nr:tripartite tricarboxylate transporter permease [Citricoccus muralis]WFP16201.1 tripartite tricarboxylate transporter permease [Citricoccus muralis]